MKFAIQLEELLDAVILNADRTPKGLEKIRLVMGVTAKCFELC